MESASLFPGEGEKFPTVKNPMATLNWNMEGKIMQRIEINKGIALSRGVAIEKLTARDKSEKPRILLYRLVELAIYIGWPAFVGIFLQLLGLNGWISLAVAMLVFLWPLIKAKYCILVANVFKKNVTNPRLNLRTGSFWFDGFLLFGSPLLRNVRAYSALSQSLDIIYNYWGTFGIEPKGFENGWWKKICPISWVSLAINKWGDFWADMPVAQDVRSRLRLVSETVEDRIERLYKALKASGDDRPIRVVTLAGGTNQDIIMAVSRLLRRFPDIRLEIVCVEPDSHFGLKRTKELLETFGIPKGIFHSISKRVSTKKAKRKTLRDVLAADGYDFSQFDLVICIGLGDYYYGDRIYDFLDMLYNGQQLITANVSGNVIERMLLHVFIQWPKMQYLSLSRYNEILSESLGKKGASIKVVSTPAGIFNIAFIN